MPFATVNGIAIHYQITGDGPRTIAWTHGVGSSLEYWQDALPKLPGFRHLSYDVRGMGQSEGTDGPVSLEVWAKDLAGLLDALDIPSAIIAGMSMGGAISQRFAIDFPERTEALLIQSTSSRVGAVATEAWRARADETQQENPHLAEAYRAVSSYNMDEELKGIRVPTLIAVGDADRNTPPGGAVIISRLIPNAELEIFPGRGHFLIQEEPKSIELADRWLEQFR